MKDVAKFTTNEKKKNKLYQLNIQLFNLLGGKK
jgi:hypothetical protein